MVIWFFWEVDDLDFCILSLKITPAFDVCNFLVTRFGSSSYYLGFSNGFRKKKDEPVRDLSVIKV